jgi:transposase-like protein
MGTIGALFDAFVSGMEDEAQRILVIIGATPEGEKSCLALTTARARAPIDWRSLLLDFKRGGR